MHPSRELVAPFTTLLSALPGHAAASVLSHSDADGLASAAILVKALSRRNFPVSADITRKGESAWSPSILERVKTHNPQALLVSDLGSRGAPLLPTIPTVLIDHHQPTGVPDGASLISGYTLDPVPTSSLLCYWCAQAVGSDADLDWLAALGLLGDLGDKNPFAEWHNAAKRHRKTVLRDLTSLINAPRRSASGDATTALNILLDAASPREALSDGRTAELEAAKAEYNEALARGRRVPPRFNGEVALITVHSPCQIHPTVAQTWAGRLRKNIVLCANTGFLPGKINFAMRTSLDRNLLDFLERVKPSGAGEEYGRGHNRATGGSLPPESWAEFLSRLGFKNNE